MKHLTFIKIISIIFSIETIGHYKVARECIEIFRRRFNDGNLVEALLLILLEKLKTL